MSNYLIISFLHLVILFSMTSQQDTEKSETGKISNQALQSFSSTLYFCERSSEDNVTSLLSNEISKHHYRFHFVKVD